MRALLPCLLALSPLAAAAQQTWVESSATVALKLSHQSAATVTLKASGGFTDTTNLLRFRLGNREILEALVAEELIPSITGWKLVALWADWNDDERGPCYRFHVKRGKGAATELVVVPTYLLDLAPILPVSSYKHIRNASEIIVAGSEKFEVLHQFAFDIDGHGGLAEGIEKGSGRFTIKNNTVFYVPGASKATLAGVYSDDGENAAGLVAGTVGFAGAKIVSIPASLPSSSSGSSSVSVGSLTLSDGDWDFSGFSFEFSEVTGDLTISSTSAPSSSAP